MGMHGKKPMKKGGKKMMAGGTGKKAKVMKPGGGLYKMMAGGMGGMGGGPGNTSIKLDMHEYKELNLSVGDKVFLDLAKAETLGV